MVVEVLGVLSGAGGGSGWPENGRKVIGKRATINQAQHRGAS